MDFSRIYGRNMIVEPVALKKRFTLKTGLFLFIFVAIAFSGLWIISKHLLNKYHPKERCPKKLLKKSLLRHLAYKKI